jgi:hypothetical protein
LNIARAHSDCFDWHFRPDIRGRFHSNRDF